MPLFRISSPRRVLLFELLDPKDEGTINCETQELFTQQHSVKSSKTAFSATLLREHQILQNYIFTKQKEPSHVN